MSPSLPSRIPSLSWNQLLQFKIWWSPHTNHHWSSCHTNLILFLLLQIYFFGRISQRIIKSEMTRRGTLLWRIIFLNYYMRCFTIKISYISCSNNWINIINLPCSYILHQLNYILKQQSSSPEESQSRAVSLRCSMIKLLRHLSAWNVINC